MKLYSPLLAGQQLSAHLGFCERAPWHSSLVPWQVFLHPTLNWFLRKPESRLAPQLAPIARLSNKFNLRRKKGPAGGALSYGFLIYGVNKQRAVRGFGKGMELHGRGGGSSWQVGGTGVGAILNEYRTGRMSSRDTLDETLTTRQDDDYLGNSIRASFWTCNDDDD